MIRRSHSTAGGHVTGVHRFPFGATVHECGIEVPDRVETFILGAYPSALHVKWDGPTGIRIAALAVDNEPEVFWHGKDADQRVHEWASNYFDPGWGKVSGSGNGSSGIWVDTKILAPLNRAGRQTRFITDCLSSYRMSDGGRAAIETRYNPFAKSHPPLQFADLQAHPSEPEIVRETLSLHRNRLIAQLHAAQPSRLITLGDAAAQVIAELADWSGSGKVSTTPYGHPRQVKIGMVRVLWFALVHPAARGKWQPTHDDWLGRAGFDTPPD